MTTITATPAILHEIESAVIESIRTLVRVMHAAADLKPDTPLPKPLVQARLAATQILRFAARLLGPTLKHQPATTVTAPSALPNARLATPARTVSPPARPLPTPPMRTALNFLHTAGAPTSLRKTG